MYEGFNAQTGSQTDTSGKEGAKQFLSSLGLEMISLAQLLTTEGEKVRQLVESFESEGQGAESYGNIMQTSRAVRGMFQELMSSESLGAMRVNDILDLIKDFLPPSPGDRQ